MVADPFARETDEDCARWLKLTREGRMPVIRVERPRQDGQSRYWYKPRGDASDAQ